MKLFSCLMTLVPFLLQAVTVVEKLHGMPKFVGHVASRLPCSLFIPSVHPAIGNQEESLGLPKDTLHCLEYHGYCFHLKSCPAPFAAFGTCYRRRKTCCVDTTSYSHICQEEGGHCVPPEISCLQEQEGLCPRRGWKCCTEV